MSEGRPLPTEDELAAIREGVRAVVSKFGDDYWLGRDDDGVFPREFHRAMADAGWLGVTMPEEYGGSGLGVTEAAVMMHEVASHGGAMAAASTVHINLFGPHPIVVKGTPEQKARWVPRLISGEDQCAFGFTEPDAGLNTTRIKTFAEKVPGGYVVRGQKVWTSTAQVASKIMLLTRTTKYEDCKRPTDGITIFYTDLDRAKIDVQRIPKMGRKAVDSNAIFIDGLFVPEEDRIGEEGKGFSYILHSLNPERILIAVEAIGIGQDALRRATRYAKERVVFDRPIGQNQGIQHPLAENWMYLESAWLMAMRAAGLYDSGRPCGAEANSAKFLGARAGHDAAWQAVMTHGGFGYAKEYHVERLLPRGIADPPRADHRATDHELHRRKGAGAAERAIEDIHHGNHGRQGRRRHRRWAGRRPWRGARSRARGRCRRGQRSRRQSRGAGDETPVAEQVAREIRRLWRTRSRQWRFGRLVAGRAPHRGGGARFVRPYRRSGQQCRKLARQPLPQDDGRGVRRRHRGPSQGLVQCQPRCGAAFQDAELRRLCPYDLDVGADRQFWAGQLFRRQAWDRRAFEIDRTRHAAL